MGILTIFYNKLAWFFHHIQGTSETLFSDWNPQGGILTQDTTYLELWSSSYNVVAPN